MPGIDRADVPDAGRGVVAALAAQAGHEGQAGRQQVGHLHAGGRVGAVVGQGDGEGDDVADVGRRVAHRLGERPGRPAAASRWRWRCCCAVFGSNWSAWLTVAVLVRASGLTTRAWISSVAAAAVATRADVPDAGGASRRCPGWASPTTKLEPRGQQVGRPARWWPRPGRGWSG